MTESRIVMLYHFEARFNGNPQHLYRHPEPGQTCRCILFWLQKDDHYPEDQVLEACEHYGFTDPEFLECALWETGGTNGAHVPLYQEALRDGSALWWEAVD